MGRDNAARPTPLQQAAMKESGAILDGWVTSSIFKFLGEEAQDWSSLTHMPWLPRGGQRKNPPLQLSTCEYGVPWSSSMFSTVNLPVYGTGPGEVVIIIIIIIIIVISLTIANIIEYLLSASF